MPQTREGRIKQFCNKESISFEFYKEQTQKSLKWCFKCRQWKHTSLFNIDNSRWDKLASKCHSCSRVKVRVNTQGKPSAFKGKKHAESARIKMRVKNAGSGNPNWKGGISSLLLQIRNTDVYKKWRYAVYLKDSFTCQNCNVKKSGRNITLDADHIKPLSKIVFEHKVKTIEEALNVAEIFDVNNGRCLCRKCHKNTPTWGVNTNKKINNGKKLKHQLV